MIVSPRPFPVYSSLFVNFCFFRLAYLRASLSQFFSQQYNQQLLGRMDRLEEERDATIDMQMKFDESMQLKARNEERKRALALRAEQQRREQEMLDRMQMEQKMRLAEQQEREKQAYIAQMEERRQLEAHRRVRQ